jgi:hypothetical protein
MARRDLIVSFLSSVPDAVMGMFAQRPLSLVSPVAQKASGKWPGGRQGYHQWVSQYADGDGNVIPGMAKAAGLGPGDTIGRVCVMGFSNGCIGVDEVLRRPDSAKIDLVLAVDGIHGAYLNQGGQRVLAASAYKRFLNHAAYVLNQPSDSRKSPVMVVTHSSIVPPGFPSTTETADFIWTQAMSRATPVVQTLGCGYDCAPVRNVVALSQLAFPGGKKICSSVGSGCFTWSGFADGWYDRRVANNFFVMGWGRELDGKVTTVDPSGNADHIFQGRAILPELLKHFAVRRWNADCGAVVSTAGLFAFDATACKLGDGLVYDESDAKKVDMFPEIGEGGGLPATPPCPAPPAGYVIVGSATNPCALAPKGTAGQPPVEPPVPELSMPTWQKALWVGAALAVGYGGVRLLTRT